MDDQQRRFAEFRPRTPPRRYVGGETHRYLGHQYRLKIVRAPKDRVVLRAGRLIVETTTPGDSGWTRTLVRRWLRGRANVILRERFDAAASIMAALGVQRPNLRIMAMKKRWGSHTKSGSILLNEALITALYEFLRTWLQRASKLIGYGERSAALKTDEERAAYLKTIEVEAQEKAKHVKLAPVFYYEHVAQVGDEKFIKSVRDYRESIKELLRDVEAIRMPLAKHEIAGTKREIHGGSSWLRPRRYLHGFDVLADSAHGWHGRCNQSALAGR